MNIRLQATVFRYFLKISYKGNKIERRIILTNFKVHHKDIDMANDYKTLMCSVDTNNPLFELNLNNGDVIEFDVEYIQDTNKRKKSYFRNPHNITVISRNPIPLLTGFGTDNEFSNPFTHKYCPTINSNEIMDDDTIFIAYKPAYYGYELAEGENIQDILIS